jgi:hypothetical protein
VLVAVVLQVGATLGAVWKVVAVSPATRPTYRGRIAGTAVPESIVALLAQIVNGAGVTETVPATYVMM